MTDEICQNKDCQYYRKRVEELERSQQLFHEHTQKLSEDKDKKISELLDKISNM